MVAQNHNSWREPISSLSKAPLSRSFTEDAASCRHWSRNGSSMRRIAGGIGLKSWLAFSLLALANAACGARTTLELLDANAAPPVTSVAAGSSGVGAGGGEASSGAAGHVGAFSADSTGGRSGSGARGVVACPSPGSPDDAYDRINGSPCDELEQFSCRGSDSCSQSCNCMSPPNTTCESSAVPVWECGPSVATCGRPIPCPLDGALEFAYGALSTFACAPEGAACGYCTCQVGTGFGRGPLHWACSLPSGF